MKQNAQPAAHSLQRLLALLMAAVLFLHPVAALAEDTAASAPRLAPPAAYPAAPDPPPTMLTIEILDGEGALNNIRQRTAREPIVEVKDENHKPVAGALILFAAQPGDSGAGPILGPAASASFNGSATLSLYTDASGRAVGRGLQPNKHTGNYTIKVTAAVGAVVAFILIHQKNVRGAWPPKPDGSPGHDPNHTVAKVTIITAVVVLAVVLIYVFTRGGGHDTTITAGNGTVGIP